MERFDPYLAWLDIPPAQRPISPYRLFSLRPGEDDPAVIAAAAARAIARVEANLHGPYAQQSQTLLDELRRARDALLQQPRTATREYQISPAPPPPSSPVLQTPNQQPPDSARPSSPPVPSTPSLSTPAQPLSNAASPRPEMAPAAPLAQSIPFWRDTTPPPRPSPPPPKAASASASDAPPASTSDWIPGHRTGRVGKALAAAVDGEQPVNALKPGRVKSTRRQRERRASYTALVFFLIAAIFLLGAFLVLLLML